MLEESLNALDNHSSKWNSEPIVLVCTNGKKDKCCSLKGYPVYKALREAAPHMLVLQSSHVGGDRFAANVISLPHGIYYGRVEETDVPDLLHHIDAGEILMPRFRGISTRSFAVQAAEQYLRLHTCLLYTSPSPRD